MRPHWKEGREETGCTHRPPRHVPARQEVATHCVPAGPARGLQGQKWKLEPSRGSCRCCGNSPLAPQRLRHTDYPGPQQIHSQDTENWKQVLEQNLYSNVHSGVIHNAKGWKQPQCSSADGVRSRQEEALPSVQGPGVHCASPCPLKPRGSPVNGAGLWPGAVGELG